MDEERVKNLIKNLIIEIGEDPTREGLRDTPKRIAKMYKEIFGGYESDSQIGVQFSEDSDTVIVKNIEFYSMCEHHMLPFFGKIHIAYLPNGRVFGVSKCLIHGCLASKNSTNRRGGKRCNCRTCKKILNTGFDRIKPSWLQEQMDLP